MNTKKPISNSGFNRVAVIILVVALAGAAVWGVVTYIQRSGNSSANNLPPVPISQNPVPTTTKTDGSSSVLSSSDAGEKGRPSKTPLSGKDSL